MRRASIEDAFVNIAGAKFDATVMHRDEWADWLRRHKPVDVAVTAFNPRPAQQKLTPAQAGSMLSSERLCDSHIEHTAREWSRVRKYVQHGDLEMAKKTLVCLVRQPHNAQQLLAAAAARRGSTLRRRTNFGALFGVHERSLDYWEAEYGARVEAMRAGLRRETTLRVHTFTQGSHARHLRHQLRAVRGGDRRSRLLGVHQRERERRETGRASAAAAAAHAAPSIASAATSPTAPPTPPPPPPPPLPPPSSSSSPIDSRLWRGRRRRERADFDGG